MTAVDKAGEDLSHDDADRGKREDRARMDRVKSEDLLAVGDESELQHRGDAPEDGQREDNRVESAIALCLATGAQHVTERIDRMDFAALHLIRTDSQARDESERGKTEERGGPDPGPRLVRGEGRRNRTAQDRREGDAFHAAHAGRDASLAADITDERILRRRIKRALHAHQENRQDDQRHRLTEEAHGAERHDRKLDELRITEDVLLLEDDGETVGEGREEDVRNDQRGSRRAHEDGLQLRVPEPRENDIARQHLQEVVVDDAEEVGDEKRDERSVTHSAIPQRPYYR